MAAAALFVIDMINDYFREGPLAARRARLVESINELVGIFDAHDQPVIWVRQEFAPDLSDAFLEMKRLDIHLAIAGTDGCRLLPELKYTGRHREIVKQRYSAFFRTELDRILAEIAPAALVIAGVNAHACVRTTVIDAYQRDYLVIVADDCVASYDPEHHEITKRYLDGRLAYFRSNAEIAEDLAAGSVSSLFRSAGGEKDVRPPDERD